MLIYGKIASIFDRPIFSIRKNTFSLCVGVQVYESKKKPHAGKYVIAVCPHRGHGDERIYRPLKPPADGDVTSHP